MSPSRVSARKFAAAMSTGALVVVVTVGAVASSSGASPESPRLYVSNVDGNSVSVIDPETNTIIAEVPVGESPRNLAISPDGAVVHVPNDEDATVSVIDTDTNAVVATVAVEPETYAAAFTPDGAESWVANKDGGVSGIGSISVIDVASSTVEATIEDPCLDGPEWIVADPDSAAMYVVNEGSDSVCVLDRSTRTSIGTVSVGTDPRSAVLTPDGSTLYVSANDVGELTRIDTASLATTVVATGGAPRNIAMTADGSTIYAPLQDGSVAVVETSTDSVTTMTFGGASELYGVALVDDEGLGYVTDADGNAVQAFEIGGNVPLSGGGLPISGSGLVSPRSIAVWSPAAPTPTPTTPTTTTTAAPAPDTSPAPPSSAAATPLPSSLAFTG